MNPDPHIWPPPPTLPEPQSKQSPLVQAFGNQRLGALSPLCVALGFAFGIAPVIFQKVRGECGGPCGPTTAAPPPNYLMDTLHIFAGCLALAGLLLGIFNWRTDGGKTGIGLVLMPFFLFLFAWAASHFH